MKALFCILAILLFLGCREGISPADLNLLGGYWEIDRVEGPDGHSRTYRINATIDYLQLEGMQGFRKKVQPQLDGSFITSDDATAFEIRRKDERYFMVYVVNGMEWQEQLLQLDSTAFSVLNEENIAYHYKRFQPIIPVR